MAARAEYKVLANSNPYLDPRYLEKIRKFEAEHFDWSRMALFRECWTLPRHQKPQVKLMQDS